MRARTVIWVALAALAGCGSEAPDDVVSPIRDLTIPRVVSVQKALNTSEIPTLDPHTMNDAEVSKVLGEGSFCAFLYVSDGKPVVAWKPQQAEAAAKAVVKLNGVLVELQRNADASATQFVADELRLTLTSPDSNERGRSHSQRPQEAKLLFEVGQRLRVGYGGYSVCPAWSRAAEPVTH